MYKSELERRRSKTTVVVAMCVIDLVLLMKFVTGQVVIVPDKPKTNSKGKAKPKPKAAKPVTPAQASFPSPTPALTPTPTPSRQPDPAPNANTTRSPYAVPFPLPTVDVKRAEPAVDVKRTEPAVYPKRTEPEARVAPPINLSEYLFDVITSDQRGNVTQSCKNRARYFTENLS